MKTPGSLRPNLRRCMIPKKKKKRTFENFLKTGTRHYFIFCILKKNKIETILKMKNNQLITLASKCLQCLVVITNWNPPLTVIRAVPGFITKALKTPKNQYTDLLCTTVLKS
jgi:hypothetical protein